MYFTSDNHHGHRNVIEFCNRPWAFHNQTDELICRWNDCVKDSQEPVFHLGDFSLGLNTRQISEIIRELNGQIHFIRGNHDSSKHWKTIENLKLPNVAWVKDYHHMWVGKQFVVLFHYPIIHFNRQRHGAWHLHGHMHGSYQHPGKAMDVGIDAHPDYTLFSWDEIEQTLTNREKHDEEFKYRRV